MKIILAFTLLYCCLIIQAKHADPKILDRDDGYTWEEHKKTHGLKYTADEDKVRKGYFDQHDAFIKAHNAAGHKSTLAHNHFSHMSDDEKKQWTGLLPRKHDDEPTGVSERCDDSSTPATLDWRNVNGTSYLTPVKNQGGCGSCWIFSGTCSMESRWAIKNKVPVPNLSEQNVVDCCGWSGCAGGFPEWTWDYIASAKDFYVNYLKNPVYYYNFLPKPYLGQEYTSNYPYTASFTNGTCKFSGNVGAYAWAYKTTDGKGIRSTHQIKRRSPAAFKLALQKGPFSVGVCASWTINFHKGGLIEASTCTCTGLNHAVNLVGYGEDEYGKYWIMRNSWGSGWGEGGYAKMEMTEEGSVGPCGVLLDGNYPNLYGDCIKDGNCKYWTYYN